MNSHCVGDYGSSPRVRGKHWLARFARAVDGLIPACAGKTISHLLHHLRCGAHPRVCGENKNSHGAINRAVGSSPRVRGKQVRETRQGVFNRLIPACAGKTLYLKTRSQHSTAHPRVCGENPPCVVVTESNPGSSPRVRGKRLGTGFNTVPDRLIPACAGKTPM